MRRSAFVRIGFAAFLAAAPLLPACIGGADGTEAAESTGRASLSLVAETNGRVYRLSNALFAIQGPVQTYLSSSESPGATVLTAALPVGDYLGVLEPGWVLERYEGGAFVPVQATLVSPNPAAFTISDGSTTELAYRFQTDGAIIAIGNGQLDISIEVIEAGGGECTPLGAGCGEGAWCVPGELVGGAPICAPGGDIPIGGACSLDAYPGCMSGALCAGSPEENAGVCVELCPAEILGAPCASGGVCSDVGYSGFGICF
ncbi:hypothetical protein WMF31_14335 [Sorangium sp. So ce1036]|uniref:hypothetical protein n=1 Tax=Sorangium sp. So ce1036 TaxID=3133328 RepID=UPI003F1229F5